MKQRYGIAVLLAAVFLLTVAACGREEAAAPAAPGQAAAPADTDAADELESMTISVVFPSTRIEVDFNGDDIARHFGEMFNVEWDPILVTSDTWAQNITIWVNARDLPDMVQWNFNYGDFVNWVDQGLIRRWPDDWRERWPNLATVHYASVVGPVLEEKMGGVYMLPRVIFFDKPTDPLVTHMNLWIRQDWAREVGVEVKDRYNIHELMEFARLAIEHDLAGDGRTIGIDLSLGNMAGVFISPFNPNSSHFYRDANGQIQWGPASYGTLEGLRLYSQAFREGLINPDFFAISTGDELANFRSGISAITFDHGFGRGMVTQHHHFEANTGLDPWESLYMSILVAPDGHHHTREVTNFWTASIFSPAMPAERFYRLMDVLNYAASEEGQNLIRMGFYGEHWYRDADGNAVITRDVDEHGNFISLDLIFPSLNPLFNNLVILPDDFGLVDPGLPSEIRETVDHRYALKQELGADAGTVELIDWDIFFFTSPAFERARMDFAEEFARLVTMDGDIEDNWRAWVDSQMPIVQIVLDEMNAQIGR